RRETLSDESPLGCQLRFPDRLNGGGENNLQAVLQVEWFLPPDRRIPRPPHPLRFQAIFSIYGCKASNRRWEAEIYRQKFYSKLWEFYKLKGGSKREFCSRLWNYGIVVLVLVLRRSASPKRKRGSVAMTLACASGSLSGVAGISRAPALD